LQTWYVIPGMLLKEMRREEVISVLKRHELEARALGVQSLFLFGSAARDQARADSDIDLFVDYDCDRFGLIELVRLKQRLSEVLGRPADVGTRDGLHPLLRDAIEHDALKVF
jgi:predicted nucleotidyltransferase